MIGLLSSLIYQAKAYGGPRRAGPYFADGFATGAGIDSLTGGTLDLVNRKIVNTCSPGADQTKVLGSAIENGHYGIHAASRAFDGDNATAFFSAQYSLNQSGVSWFGWDFGTPQDITSLTIAQHNAASPYCQPISSVKVQYSSDLSAWSDVGTFGLAADTSVQSLSWTSVGAKRAFRVLANANVATTGYCWGVKEATLNLPGTVDNIVLTGVAQTDTSDAPMVGAFEFNPIDTITTSDILLELYRGSDFQPATLYFTHGQNGRTLAYCDPVTCAAGSFGYRLSSLNGKRLEIAGAAVGPA